MMAKAFYGHCMNLNHLNTRNREIFRSIVENYLETGDPIGSKFLAEQGKINVSSATVRNVMAGLEAAGLIVAPHTSAGRIPTDLGLRLFVDGMMEMGNLSTVERASIEGKCNSTGTLIDDVLENATRTLSGLSHCASVVMVPKSNLAIRHIEFVPYSAEQALVVLVTEDGSIENRLINLPLGLPSHALVSAGNYLNARLHGRTIDEAQEIVQKELAAHQAELDALTARVVEGGLAVWTGEATAQHSLMVSGQGNLLNNIDAEADLVRIQHLFDDLENKKELLNLLSLAQKGSGVKMFIGAENNLFSLSGSSLVVAPYMKGSGNVVGVIGVIGPTRLNYARIIPMVDYTAEVVSRNL